jgi:4-hydroxymandelate oxidase
MTTAAGLVTLDDYERAAQERIAPAAWEYIHSGAADEHTLRWNREAFARIMLSPRVLNDVSRIDTGVSVLGCDLAHPIMLAPIAAHVLAHPEGEVATARGARAAGAGMILSSYTSRRIEDVVAAAPSPLWFQLYVQERAATRDLVSRVADAGCSALCITVDTPTSGARDRQARSEFEFPADLPYRTVEPGNNPCTWDDIAWIRASVKIPVVLKGILRPDDAELAIQAGAHAIVVSNHGARNLDTAPAAIDALRRVAERTRGRIPLLMDGGIRRGTDVLKALALGADFVFVGRPFLFAASVGGERGVSHAIEILRSEIARDMALLGIRDLSEAGRDLVMRTR